MYHKPCNNASFHPFVRMFGKDTPMMVPRRGKLIAALFALTTCMVGVHAQAEGTDFINDFFVNSELYV